MAAWVNIDGALLPAAEARVSVLDRGFLYGDSVYEVLRTFRGLPLFWGEHDARLRRSASLLQLPIPVSGAALRERMVSTLARAGHPESHVRVIVTRGDDVLDTAEALLRPGASGDLSSEPGPGPVVIIVRPFAPLPATFHQRGCVLATFRTARADEGGVDPRAKSGDTLLAIVARSQARAQGAYEALRIDPLGRVLEGASSTFFLVRAGRLLTPPLEVGILPGITRSKVLELARQQDLPVEEAPIYEHDLQAGCEAFITSTTRDILPVRRIDALELGAPGPVTRRLMAAYQALMARSIES